MQKQKAIMVDKGTGVGMLNVHLQDGWRVVDKTVLGDKVIYILAR